MNKLLAFITALLLCGTTFAADAPPPASKMPAAKTDKLAPDTAACPKMGMGGGMGMGMMGSGMGGSMSPDLMKKMQEQMAAIRQATDPGERQKLMQEHFQSMQEAMQSMRGSGAGMGGMGGCGGCCCQQHCARGMSGKSPAAGANCARKPATGNTAQGTAPGNAMSGMMEQRMDMMQTMMENMLEHQRQMQQGK